LTAFRVLAVLIVFAIVGCGQSDDNFVDYSTRNDLLLQSINADYERFEKNPIYRRTKLWFPKRLQPMFRFLTDGYKLKDNSLKEQRLDTLTRLKNQILNHARLTREATNKLCEDQIQKIENKLNSLPGSNKEIEAFRNEVLQLEKTILYSDLQTHYYMAFSLIDTLGIKVVPESEVVKLGEPYRAKVYFAAYVSLGHKDIEIYKQWDTLTYEGINPIDTFEVKRGRDGFIEYYPTESGEQSIAVIWPMITNSNQRLRFLTEAKFTVKK
jgi:hypothetical protein